MPAKKLRMGYKFSAQIWVYPGEAAWHFVTIPKPISQNMKAAQVLPRRGFGAVKVQVILGKSTWLTSIFPDSKSGCYILPIKANIRKKEKVYSHDVVELVVTLVTPGKVV